jgi:hypothetical protein
MFQLEAMNIAIKKEFRKSEAVIVRLATYPPSRCLLLGEYFSGVFVSAGRVAAAGPERDT